MLREGFWSEDRKPTAFIDSDYHTTERGIKFINQLNLIHKRIKSISSIDWMNIGFLGKDYKSEKSGLGLCDHDLQYVEYAGYHTCLICGKNAGDAEYTLRGKWIVPEGYKHYVEVHDVKPSEEFETFLLALDVESMSLPWIEPAVVKPAVKLQPPLPLSDVESSAPPTLDFSDTDEVYTQLMLQRGLGAVTFKIPRAVVEKNLQRVLGGMSELKYS